MKDEKEKLTNPMDNKAKPVNPSVTPKVNPISEKEVKPIVIEKKDATSALSVKSEVKPEVKPVINSSVKPDVKPLGKDDVKPMVKPGDIKPEVKPEAKFGNAPEAKNEPVRVGADNLADKLSDYSHGLTKAQIDTMSFAEILTVILKDVNVTDITFNGKDIYIQHNTKGRYRFTTNFSKDTIFNFVKDVANPLNETFNVEHPILDCEIKDVYTSKKNAILRLNAVHESISPYGHTLAIRITQPELRLAETDSTFAPKGIFKLIEAMVRGNLNILISGRTGAGKTELQKFLVKYIRDAETIVLIEDTKDTDLKNLYPNKNISSWVTNTKKEEPKIDFDVLIRASLRNNPDWIIVSETRGSEAYQMIKSGLSGHRIITTLHSDSAESNVDRLIHMCKESYNLDQVLLGKMITDVFDIGIHIDYDITESGTKRYICEIVEYKDYTERGVVTNPIYTLKLQPIKNADGTIRYEKLNQHGKISKTLFDKLAKKQVLSEEIADFIEEGYYGKERKN